VNKRLARLAAALPVTVLPRPRTKTIDVGGKPVTFASAADARRFTDWRQRIEARRKAKVLRLVP
jgi:hypothetical protein